MWFTSLSHDVICYVIVSFASSWIGRCYYSDIMLLPCFIIVISEDTLYHDVKVTVCASCVSLLASVYMNCWCLLEPSSALKVTVWGNLVWGNVNFEECFIALRIISVRYQLENSLEWHIEVSIYGFNYVISLRVTTSESMIPRPCFQALNTIYI
jgi:hypothetical protein